MNSYGCRPVACPNTVIATIDSRAVEYHTIKVLGHGDHTSVYELQDAHTAAAVAAKVFPKARLQQLKEQQQRLQQQVTLQQALQHEHIVRLLGSCEDSSNIYMLMEACTGVSVEDLLQQRGPFSEQQAATVLSQVLPAVAHLHQQGLAHCDLQLSRLLLHSSGCIKLCGFSSAAPLADDGQRSADVWAIGVMLYTMLVGQPPVHHQRTGTTRSAASCSSSVQLCFPQQLVLSEKATQLLAALLRPEPEQRPGLADISCHPFMQQWLGKPCSLGSSTISTTAARVSVPAAVAVDSCLALDDDISSCAAGSTVLEQYIDRLQQQVSPAAGAAAAAVGGAAGSSSAVLSASWQLPHDCIAAGGWDNSDSGSSSRSVDGSGAFAAASVPLEHIRPTPQLPHVNSPLRKQLLQQQQQQQQQDAATTGCSGADQWPVGQQQQQQQHVGKFLRIDAPGPSFSGWGVVNAACGSSPSPSSTQQHGLHYGVEQLHKLLQQKDAEEEARGTCRLTQHSLHQQQLLGHTSKQQHQQQAHSAAGPSLVELRTVQDASGTAVAASRVSSSSLPDLPSSSPHCSGVDQGEVSMQAQILAGSHFSDSARECPLALHGDGSATYNTSRGSSQQARSTAGRHSPAYDLKGSFAVIASGTAGSGSSSSSSSRSSSRSAVQRALPPSPLQVPQSPRAHNMFVQPSAVPRPAAAEPSYSNNSGVPVPVPPPVGSGSFALCASPRVAGMLRQMAAGSTGGSSGNGAAATAALASPAVSPLVPMVARLYSHNFCSAPNNIQRNSVQGELQPAQAEAPCSPPFAGLTYKPVYRDISTRLQACTDAQQPAAAAQGWQGNWQQQQPGHAAGVGAAGSSQATRGRLPVVGEAFEQQQQPVHARFAPLPRAAHASGAMSPAPPPVPPSPLQQHAAGLRSGGRRSCSNIPASPGSQMMAEGWRPTPRRNAAVASAAAAAVAAQNSCLSLSPRAAARYFSAGVLPTALPEVDGASLYQGPGSPMAAGMLKPMPSGMMDSGSFAANYELLDAPADADTSKNTCDDKVNSLLQELVNSTFGSSNQLPAMPSRGKPGSFGMNAHQQPGSLGMSLGSGGFLQLNRPAGLSDHGLSSMGSGRFQEQGLGRPGRLTDHGVSSLAGSSSCSNLMRLQEQGSGALGAGDGVAEQQSTANLSALAHLLPNKQQQQQQQQQQLHAAARPPLHHAHSLPVAQQQQQQPPQQQHHDWPYTPKVSGLGQQAQQRGSSTSQQRLDQQPDNLQSDTHGRGVRRSPSEDQQQLTERTQQQEQQLQSQQPVPPKQQQPQCRSPCVSMRAAVPSPLAGVSGQLQQPICSPVPEQRQYTPLSNASSVDYRSLLQLGVGCDGQSSRGGTPTGTPLFSTGRYPISLGPPSTGASTAAPGGARTGASSSGRAGLGLRQMSLPPPAFHHFLNMGLDTPPVAAPAAAACSSNCSPEEMASAPAARAALDDDEQPSPLQEQFSMPNLAPLRRTISTPAAGSSSSSGGDAGRDPFKDALTAHHSSSNNSKVYRTMSSGGAAGAGSQWHTFTPHPPASALDGLLSPKAGSQTQLSGSFAVLSGSFAVQPCPPNGSQPPAPSPSVRTRVAHGNIMSHVPPAQQQYAAQQQQQQTWQAPDGPGAAGATMSDGTTLAAPAAAAPCRTSSASAADVRPSNSGSSAGSVKSRSRSAVMATRSWDSSCQLTLPVVDEANCELQLDASGSYAMGAGDESCGTPNVEWPAGTPSIELLQEQAEERQRRLSVDFVQDLCEQVVPGRRQPAGAAAWSASGKHVSFDGSSSSSSKRASLPHVPPQRRPSPAGPTNAADLKASSAWTGAATAAAAAGGHPEGCPGWPSPVVAAFAHCKGRLGYLMSSGVVGVVFEDSTHMFVRSSDGWACYHEHANTSITAASLGSAPGVGLEASFPAAAASAASKSSNSLDSHVQQQQQQQHLWSPDTGRYRPTVKVKDQDGPSAGSLAAVAAAAKADASSGPTASAAAVTFLLPGSGSPGPASVGADGSSSSNNIAAPPGAPGVPEHLAGKARCLRRFVGCLLHQQPYSSSCQPHITRLPFHVARTGLVDQAAAAATAAAQQGGRLLMHAVVPHLGSFVHREGCLHLKITDGCHQLVFTGDNSVLLLDARCSQLAYVTHSRARKGSRQQAAAAPAGDDAAADAGMATVQVLDLASGGTAAALPPPDDARLLARAAYAGQLVQALQLPASWLERGGSSSAAVSAAAH